MPIKFNVIEKGQPGAVGGGVKKQYANTVRMGKMTLDQLTTGIEKISTVYPTASKNKINMGKKKGREKNVELTQVYRSDHATHFGETYMIISFHTKFCKMRK